MSKSRAVMGGTVVFMTFLSVIGYLPSVRAQTIRGTDFVLTGPQGNITARLTTSGEGSPALFFYDAQNTVRLSVGLYSDGTPHIVLDDDSGRASAILRLVQNNGNPVLVLKENGQDKLVIDKNGLPRRASPIAPSLVIGFAAGLIGGLLAAAFVRKSEQLWGARA